MLLKGDRVILKCGRTGEVIEIWGFAKTFARIKLDSSPRTIPVMASEVSSYARPVKPMKGGAYREKRKKTNQTPEASDVLYESQSLQLVGL